MSKTIMLTDEQYAALQAGEAITIKPPKSKWEPEGGDWFSNSILGEGEKLFRIGPLNRLSGLMLPTRELAEKAAISARKRQRLVAYVLEHAPEHDVDGKGWVVCLDYTNHFNNSFFSCVVPTLGAVTMPKDVARKLLASLKSGEVVL